MTWYASEVLCVATPHARRKVLSNPLLAQHAYNAAPPLEHDWYADEARHGLPEEGLLVVQPLAHASGDATEWHDTALDWNELEGDPALLRVSPHQICRHQSEASASDFPPPATLAYLKKMSEEIAGPVVYYACTMWGGSVELEYAWIFGSTECALVRTPVWGIDDSSTELTCFTAAAAPVTTKGDVLIDALATLGLLLPTRYFALHTRDFPWERHKLVAAK